MSATEPMGRPVIEPAVCGHQQLSDWIALIEGRRARYCTACRAWVWCDELGVAG